MAPEDEPEISEAAFYDALYDALEETETVVLIERYERTRAEHGENAKETDQAEHRLVMALMRRKESLVWNCRRYLACRETGRLYRIKVC